MSEEDIVLGSFALIFLVYGLLFLVLIAAYIVNSLGFFKLYKAAGYAQRAWMAWVPCFNIYALAAFLTEELELPAWQKIFMGFYWAMEFVPVVGSLAGLFGAILAIVNEFRYVSKYEGGALQYVLIFIFPILLPYLWIKNY